MNIIRKASRESENLPLVINFSGGKDSLLMLDLVQKISNNFICFYSKTGIEFPEAIESVKETAKERDLEIHFSCPEDHKGTFFERLKKFKSFPKIKTTWCSRDLKWRPQKKVLTNLFGINKFYKLNGVRRYESVRRRLMYKASDFFRKDSDVHKDIMVFPILNWTTKERDRYLLKYNIRIATEPLYKKYKVSGCYWCPFYQYRLYRPIIRDNPHLYDKFIEWEIKLNQPSIPGYKWLKNLRDEIRYTKTLDTFTMKGNMEFQKTIMDYIKV